MCAAPHSLHENFPFYGVFEYDHFQKLSATFEWDVWVCVCVEVRETIENILIKP